MNKKLFSIFLLCVLLQFSLLAQQPLDYSTFITNIKKNHPLIKRANNIGEIGNAQLQSARGNYDPTINGNYENKYYNSKNYYSILNSEIKQPIFTSQYLKAGYEYGQGTNISPEETTSSYGLGYIGIEASLLQGLVIDKRRAEVLKAQHYKAINNAEQKQLTNAILFDASVNYAEWLYSQRVVIVFNYFNQLATERFIAIKQLALSGERAAIDTTEASMLAQQRFLDYLSASVENQKKIADVATSNWQSDKADVFSVSLKSLDSLNKLVNDLKIKMAVELNESIINNPLIEQYNAKQKFLQVEKRYKAELIKPKLDVKYNFLTSNSINNFSTQLSTNNYRWGASLSFPLFLRSSVADFKIAKLNLQNTTYELDNKQNELQNQIILTVNSINIIEQQLKTAASTVAYSKEMVIAEKIKFNNGESSLFLINTRETKWLESELKLIEYQLKYTKNIFSLIYLKGNLNYSL